MKVFGKQVAEYIRAAETLLSPASLREPLTKDECHVVELYSKSIAVYIVIASDTARLKSHAR